MLSFHFNGFNIYVVLPNTETFLREELIRDTENESNVFVRPSTTDFIDDLKEESEMGITNVSILNLYSEYIEMSCFIQTGNRESDIAYNIHCFHRSTTCLMPTKERLVLYLFRSLTQKLGCILWLDTTQMRRS